MWMSDEQIDRLAEMQLGMEDVGGWKVRDAYELAKKAHDGRTDCGRPYICRLVDVAAIVSDSCGTDGIVTALLHRIFVLGVGITTMQDIGREFGHVVAENVRLLTDHWALLPDDTRAIVESGSRIAMCVSLADICVDLCNVPRTKDDGTYGKRLQMAVDEMDAYRTLSMGLQRLQRMDE